MDVESETVISEREVPGLIEEYLQLAENFFESDDYKNSINALTHGEELIAELTNQGGPLHPNYVLATLHNLGVCYFYLNDLANASYYLEAAVQNRTQTLENHSNLFKNGDSLCRDIGEKVKSGKYLCKVHLQLSKIYSIMGRHKSALDQAKQALNYSLSIFQSTYKLCENHLSTHKVLFNSRKLRRRVGNPQYNLLKSPHYKHYHDLVVKVKPILEFAISESLSSCSKKSSTFKEMLSVSDPEDWVGQVSFSELLRLEPISLEKLEEEVGIHSEITRDNVLEKVVLLVLSYYSLGTETKSLLRDCASEKTHSESLAWLKKALEVARTFLPENSSILKQVKETYNSECKTAKTQKRITRKVRLSTRSPRKSDLSIFQRKSKSPFSAVNKNTLRCRSSLSRANRTFDESFKVNFSSRRRSPLNVRNFEDSTDDSKCDFKKELPRINDVSFDSSKCIAENIPKKKKTSKKKRTK